MITFKNVLVSIREVIVFAILCLLLVIGLITGVAMFMFLAPIWLPAVICVASPLPFWGMLLWYVLEILGWFVCKQVFEPG